MSCIFCQIVNREIPAERLYEDADVLVFLDAFPISRGHSLVIPKQHQESIAELPDQSVEQLARALRACAPAIARGVSAQGFNIGLNSGRAAGQIIPHVHWHVIPRFDDDGLRHWPNTRVSQNELSSVAGDIRSALKQAGL